MRRSVYLLAGLMFWLSGCVSLGSFQGPDVLPEGKYELGVGVVGGGELGGEGGIGLMELYGRMGVAPRLEVGVRTTGFLAAEGVATGAIMVEGKYQLLRGPLLTAAGMGISYYGLEVNDDRFTTVGLYPSLWVGTSRVYVGARMLVVTVGASNADEVGTGSLAGVMVGASLGGRFRIRPELTLYKPLYEGAEGALLMGGVGLAFRF